MLITVFTPAYNRAYLLPRLYESLQRQTFHDFEWVIVDDGSTDDTRSVVEKFSELRSQDSMTPAIRYFYQENGGKHRAINRGVKEARGELFFIVDSDDFIVDNALEIIAKTYKDICHDKSFGGVAGLLMHSEGTIIGTMPNKSPLDCTQVEYWCKYKIKGDKTEIFRTDVLREIPFPEYDGEKFCPEELEWLRIAKKYKMRYVNEVLAVRDYLDGGLTSKIVKIRMESPRATIEDYALYNTFSGIPLKQKIRNAINYWRFKFCLKDNNSQNEFNNNNVKPIFIPWVWAKPIGWFMHLRDKKKHSK